MSKKNLSILFAVSEVNGLAKSGGLADFAKSLTESLVKLGQDVRLVLPDYRKIVDNFNREVVLSTRLEHWPHTAYSVAKLSMQGVPIYCIRCSKYFDRSDMYEENNEAYTDNGERFAFFSAACLDILPKLAFCPNIVHANDWQTGFVAYFLKKRYAETEYFQSMRCVISIHNAAFKGMFTYEELQYLPEFRLRCVPEAEISSTHVTMLKAGIVCADKINAVSPTYAEELKTELGSHGMQNEFRSRSKDFIGILNGCDYSVWNPEIDKYLPKNYRATYQSMSFGKKVCKQALQCEMGLPVKNVAMYGMVCRLTNQKGLHYLLPILDNFLEFDVQLVIIGVGDPFWVDQLRTISTLHCTKFAFLEIYDDRLAHLIEAGSDFFLMPSEFEPCGLNQMYSMAYGTLPIVRGVGGLKDSVKNYDSDSIEATGFVFDKPSSEALLVTISRSLILYIQNPKEIDRLKLNAMKQRFFWSDSARKYIAMYRSALSESA
ncbi:glycogen synthase GlgA [Candidatus Photodesmus blepharus]|uniref:glycogen synthase GlgA n=1 Tax=Candidatus Photodesmus blepharonis TaxID=1179155 RepID=UPI00054E0ED2|nr:glycogen synthase GlgA [Candidatus Photodesmus blepharus]